MSAFQIRKPEAKPVEQKLDEKSILHKQQVSDSFDEQKQKKSLQLKTVDELEKHIIELRNRIQMMAQDFDVKRKVIDGLNASIAGAHSELNMVQNKFRAENAKLVTEYEKKLADVTKSDDTLQKLVQENRVKEKELNHSLATFEQEKHTIKMRMADLQNSLNQNNVEWKKREADILLRESALKTEKDEFELYKESLAPEAARISSTKNENELLLKKIEMQRVDIENMRAASQRDRDSVAEQRVANEAKATSEKLRVSNEEARLRKWEQDIKDAALELRVQQDNVQKILRREQLEKEVKASEEAKEKK